MGLLAFDADKLLIATIIGISTGAIYAVIASGLVVTYNTSGLFNLAHGATGVLAAFTYWQFRFGWGWPTPLALLIVLGLGCPLYGWFVERFVMRGLRNTTEVVRLSVTVALFAAVLGLVNWLWPTGPNRAAMVRFYEGRQVSIGGINVAYHKLITMGCAVLVAIFLRLLMYRSRTGVAMRAVVDDRDLGELNGAHPVLQAEALSHIALLSAVILVWRGFPGLRLLAFPLFFLVFMIPLPGTLVQAVTLPLKSGVSYVAEHLLYQLGYPIARSGVTLQIAQYQLLVADACAGLNSMFTLESLGLLYMNIMGHTNRLRNVLLALLIVPISFAANVVRVVILILVTYYFGDAVGQGFVHGFAGMVLFGVAFILMLVADSVVGRLIAERAA